MLCHNTFLYIIQHYTILYHIILHYIVLYHIIIDSLYYSQWLEFMAAPLIHLIENGEELEPNDGMNIFEIPPLGIGFTEEVRNMKAIYTFKNLL